MNTCRIKIGDSCPNDCYFCAARGERFDTAREHIARKLAATRASGCDSIVFAGLEPAAHPDFPGFCAAAVKLGFSRIAAETSALPFSSPSLAKRSAALGLSHASILFVDSSPEAYDRTTGRPGSFRRFMRGVRNLRNTGTISISARIPVCGANYRRISEIAAFAISSGADSIRAVFPENYFFDDEYLDISALDAEIAKTRAIAKSAGIHFFFNRSSKFFRYAAESQERAAHVFYPSFQVGRRAKTETLEALIRPTFSCNQICKFCYVDCAQKDPSPESVEAEIRRVIKKRIPKLAFSGGEPTLDPRLPRYIALAKQGGVRQVEIHTNAIRAANPSFCQTLADAGLDIAFCTLLAPGAALSDSITRTGGSFRKTVAGILNLLQSKVHTVAHFVIMEDNYRALPEFVRFSDETFSHGGNKLPLTFSYVAPRDLKAAADGIVPRFSDAMPFLRKAIDECILREIPYCAGEGLKGVPPCVLPLRDNYLRQLLPQPRNIPGHSFVKKPECAGCSCGPACFGVRRYYAEQFGLDEIKPVT